MKKVFGRILIFLLIAAAAAWLLYPVVSDQMSRRNDAEQMKAYHRAVRGKTAEEIETAFEETGYYNSSLETEGIPDVFSAKQRVSSEYRSRMNVCDGVIGELKIPAINVYLPVYHGGIYSAAEKLVHVAGTALPADQDGTHIVLAGPGIQKAKGFPGSLGLTDARMLEDIDRVVPDDLVFLEVLDRTMIFRVEGVQMLSVEGLAGVDVSPETGSQTLTLVTEKAGRTMVIRARRTEAAEVQDNLAAQDRADVPPDLVNVLFMGIPVFVLGLLVMGVIERIKKRSYRLPTEQKRKRKKTDPDEFPDDDDGTETDKPEGTGKQDETV